MELDYFSAFMIGLMGSGHCIGMCGGITTMFTSTLDKSNSMHRLYIWGYNLGRISSYSLIGAIAGFTGSLAAKSIGLPIAGLKIIAGIFLILLGLYIGQWMMALSRIESIGKYLWQHISPLTKQLLPVNSFRKSVQLGALWGWLPCGLVYSTLTWSVASSSATTGALIMASFGLGTLPALLTMSYSVTKLQVLLKQTGVRKVIAILLILYGLYTLKIASAVLF